MVLVAVRGAEHSTRIRDDLLRLQDTTALIGAGLLSVLCFPLAGLILLRRDGAAREPDVEPAPMLAM